MGKHYCLWYGPVDGPLEGLNDIDAEYQAAPVMTNCHVKGYAGIFRLVFCSNPWKRKKWYQ
jgi:hypothetical protein